MFCRLLSKNRRSIKMTAPSNIAFWTGVECKSNTLWNYNLNKNIETKVITKKIRVLWQKSVRLPLEAQEIKSHLSQYSNTHRCSSLPPSNSYPDPPLLWFQPTIIQLCTHNGKRCDLLSIAAYRSCTFALEDGEFKSLKETVQSSIALNGEDNFSVQWDTRASLQRQIVPRTWLCK